MSAPAAETPAKPKSKKMLIIIVAVVVLALVGGGAAFMLMGKKASDEEADGEEQTSSHEDEHKTPPQFMPIDPIVVNLADPDTPRFAQIGITLQVADAKTADQIKLYMPAIRNGILLKMSAQTSAHLLQPEGKTQLAEEILELVREKSGFESKKKNPVQEVLFSSIIVQ